MTLEKVGLACWSDYLEPRHAGRMGRRVIVYQQTASTQNLARHLVDGVADPGHWHGTVIAADHQTAGRGRLGRSWFSEPGSAVLMTIIVDQGCLTSDRLMLASAVGLADAIESVCSLNPRIRWPNDLLVGTGKLAGLLVETVNRLVLIGLGMNVHPLAADQARLDQPTTSLADHGAAVDRLRLIDAIFDCLDTALYRTDAEQLAEQWRRRSSLLQQRVTARCGNRTLTGRVIDIDPQHGLLLEVERGPVITLPAATTSLVAEGQ
jgi:BirA family biotin operon repressor/biotin-[acetyl-CoA-carboxylase] ligase